MGQNRHFAVSKLPKTRNNNYPPSFHIIKTTFLPKLMLNLHPLNRYFHNTTHHGPHLMTNPHYLLVNITYKRNYNHRGFVTFVFRCLRGPKQLERDPSLFYICSLYINKLDFKSFLVNKNTIFFRNYETVVVKC
jgi:hypothetical protein